MTKTFNFLPSVLGRGDLNLKKEWHPQTYKNQEEVWKREQAVLAEQNNRPDVSKGKYLLIVDFRTIRENDLNLSWTLSSGSHVLHKESYRRPTRRHIRRGNYRKAKSSRQGEWEWERKYQKDVEHMEQRSSEAPKIIRGVRAEIAHLKVFQC